MRTALLTDAEMEQLVAWRDEWLAVGMSCEPVDRDAAEAAMTRLYASIGKPRPMFVHVRGPLELTITGLMMSAVARGGHLGDQLGDHLGDQLREQLGGQLGGQLRGQLWDQLRGQLGGQIRDQLWGQLGDQLWDQLRGQLGDQLWEQLGDQLGDQLWGQHESYWIAWYAFARDVLGVTYPQSDVLDAWTDVCRTCGWFAAREGVCIIADRPERQMLDEAGLLHAEDGPAILTRDGVEVWAWHGTRVEREVIATPPSEVTAEQIAREENAEVRRVYAERIGNAELMRVLGASVINASEFGVLWDAAPLDGMGVERCRWVELVDASPEPIGSGLPELDEGWTNRYAAMTGARPMAGRRYRRYLIPVPAEIPTAHAAVAWHHGMTTDEYVLSGIEAS